MYTKYSTNKTQEKHRRILKRRIKSACTTVILLAILYIVGIAGGLEQDLLTFNGFIIRAVITSAIMWIAGVIVNRI